MNSWRREAQVLSRCGTYCFGKGGLTQLLFIAHTEGSMDEVSNIMGLFCLCYSHVLVSLDDEEFFKRQTCFSLKEVLFMSLALKVTSCDPTVKQKMRLSHPFPHRKLYSGCTG